MSGPTHETLFDQPGFRVNFDPDEAKIILIDLSDIHSEGGNVEISAALWPGVRQIIDRRLRDWRAEGTSPAP